jgi:hypothetical protein
VVLYSRRLHSSRKDLVGNYFSGALVAKWWKHEGNKSRPWNARACPFTVPDARQWRSFSIIIIIIIFVLAIYD